MSHITRRVENLRRIFLQGVKSVQPSALFTNNLKSFPEIESDSHSKNCYVVGFGKAVLGMAVQLERILVSENWKLVSGIVSIPIGTKEKFANSPDMTLSEHSEIKVYEAAENNLPDQKATNTAKMIKSLAESMTCDDILFVLISGGGSALLPLPKAPFTLDQKLKIILNLTRQGAGISDLNIVRIALSEIKGGKLARAAKNADKVISFIISDIINDPIDLIASGPTVQFHSQSKRSAMEILEQYNIWESLQPNEKTAILEEDPEIELTNNYIHIIGNNQIAAEACAKEALEIKYIPFILSTTVEGNVLEISKNYVNFLKSVCSFRNGTLKREIFINSFPYSQKLVEDFCESVQNSQPLLLILAGEPTVIVKGSGKGGRNQELALRMSLEFYLNEDLQHITFLSAGTDGIDGPTLAAGAIGCANIIEEFLRENPSLDAFNKYLENNDSFSFYNELENEQYHVITNHTGTNVMDLHLFLIP